MFQDEDAMAGLQQGIGAPAAVTEEVVESPNTSVIVLDSTPNTPANTTAQSRVVDLLTPKGMVRPGGMLPEAPPAKRHSPDPTAEAEMDTSEEGSVVLADDSVSEEPPAPTTNTVLQTPVAAQNGMRTNPGSSSSDSSIEISETPERSSSAAQEAPYLSSALGKSSKIIESQKLVAENEVENDNETAGSPPRTPTKQYSPTRSPVTPRSGKKLDRSGVKLSVKRRRSVCHNMASLLDANEAVVSPRVVREELDFSPSTQRASSGSDNVQYEDFTADAKLHANSTRIGDITMMRRLSMETSAIAEEEPEEEEEEEALPPVISLQRIDSTETDSPIAAVNKKAKQRTQSSDEEEEEEEEEEVCWSIVWTKRSGPWFDIKMSSYQCRKSHCGDKTVVRSSYLHNGISYTGKMTSLYWFSPLSPDSIHMI